MATVKVQHTKRGGGFEGIAKRVEKQLPDLMKDFAAEMHAAVMETFETETDPYGDPWKPLEESTLRARFGRTKSGRRAMNPRPSRRRNATRRGLANAGRGLAAVAKVASAKILSDRGTLRASFRPQATKNTASVRTNYAPAKAHQFGRPDNKFPNSSRGVAAPIPARPMLPIRGNQTVLPPDLHKEFRAQLVALIRGARRGG